MHITQPSTVPHRFDILERTRTQWHIRAHPYQPYSLECNRAAWWGPSGSREIKQVIDCSRTQTDGLPIDLAGYTTNPWLNYSIPLSRIHTWNRNIFVRASYRISRATISLFSFIIPVSLRLHILSCHWFGNNLTIHFTNSLKGRFKIKVVDTIFIFNMNI